MPDTAIVLAGGLGTRLRPLVSDRPKVLAQSAGAPFLDYVLRYLASQGIGRVILSVGYMANQIKRYAGNGSRWNLEICYSEESTPLGTGGALRMASAGLEKTFFALNGDTLFTADLEVLWQAHTSTGAGATIALLLVKGGQERGCVTLAEDGRILSFEEKPQAVEQAHGVQSTPINAGVYVLEPRALDSVQTGQQVSIERQVFPALAARGQLYGQVQRAYFADIGTPQSLAAFERDILSGEIARILSASAENADLPKESEL